MKKSFMIYHQYSQQFELLCDADLGRLLRALIAYETDRLLPDFEGMLKMAFSFIKAQLDRDSDKYAKTMEARKAAGRKGGLAKASNARHSLTNLPVEVEGEVEEEVEVKVEEEGEVEVEEKVAFSPFVNLTHTQYKELVNRLGKQKTADCIQLLGDYKASHGKQYASDFHAICSWVVVKHGELEAKARARPAGAGAGRTQNFKGRNSRVGATP